MASAIKPSDLREISSAAEQAKMNEEREWKRHKAEMERELREAFMTRDIHPEVMDRVNKAVRQAAELGFHEVQIITFPSKFCNDRGRRINNFDPDWPDSLEGFAKKAYQYFEKELKPLGYNVTAQIISYPDGMPGEVALYLKW
jgi:hypothetical protein